MPVNKYKLFLALLACLSFMPLRVRAFSILAHEAIIDASWTTTLRPMLKQKYPNVADTALKEAHSYAYGGSLMADIGYMPGGNAFFTDLLHYVRSGDFIINLIAEARDVNEYAFALGALSHYMADKYGHSLATNVLVPKVYPDLKKKFGNVVTYEDDHTSHSRMEFAYDAIQVGRGNYATSAYHDFVGFNIASAPLERAFLKTYGLELNSIFKNIPSAVSTLRWGVKNLFPVITKQAWKANQSEILKANPGTNKKKFRFKMNRLAYKKEFGAEHGHADFKARLIGFFIKILPKIGPLKNFKFVYPGKEGEQVFLQTLDTIFIKYNFALKQVTENRLYLQDINFDTGQQVAFGKYSLADNTFYTFVMHLKEAGLQCMTPSLKENILGYYNKANLDAFFEDRTKNQQRDLVAQLKLIRATKPVSQQAAE